MAALGSIGGGPLGLKPDSLGNATDANNKALLNTYIYNYFIGEGLVDIAKALRGSRLPFKDSFLSKDDSSDGDNKDDGGHHGDGGLGGLIPGGDGSKNFLPNWWCMFWDMWSAARTKEKPDTTASQFLAFSQRARQQQQNAMMQQQGMIGPNFHRFNPMQPQMDMPKRAIVNNGRLMQQMGMQNQMQRDGSDVDMNGVPRGQSPMPGENAPSPKRPRVDGGGFNQQIGPNGRPQVMGAQAPNGNAPSAPMLMASTFDPQGPMSPNFGPPNGLSKQQMYAQDMANQAKSAIHGMPKNVMGMAPMPQNSPMLATGPDGQPIPQDMFNNPGMQRNSALASGNGGALADYQMQLMLLEQQNKKRLMMARQEQDVAQRDQGGVGPQGLMGQQGFAPAMSPHVSRTGHSPNSNDPAKRGTPKDSPLPDSTMGMGRNSPGPVSFEAGQMQGNMVPPFSMVGGPNGMMVRPNNLPGAGAMPQQLEMMRQQQNARIVNGAWPPTMHNPAAMMQQGQGVMQPHQMDGNPQRTSMPPPQGPANGRTQPPSPQQAAAAPPTPQQTTKAAPKKKDTKDKPKKPNKKASTTTGATPSEVEQADEVPPTPRTPKNPAADIIKGTKPPSTNINMVPQQPPPSMPSSVMHMSAPPDNSVVAPFGSLNDGSDMPTFDNFEDILAGDNTDVLHGFDFDAFLHNEPVPGFDFDAPYLNGDNPLETMGE